AVAPRDSFPSRQIESAARPLLPAGGLRRHARQAALRYSYLTDPSRRRLEAQNGLNRARSESRLKVNPKLPLTSFSFINSVRLAKLTEMGSLMPRPFIGSFSPS